MPPLRGLGCFWWDAFYKDGAPTALALWGNGLGITDMPPLRGLICFWRDGFYRDFAPTGLDLLLVGRVLQRWRAYGARVVGGNGL
jgi:hypothetical protein